HARDAEPELGARYGYFSGGVIEELFPRDLVLLPQCSQIYELDLALAEFKMLGREKLAERSAYFWKVNGEETHHYRICTKTPNQVDEAASINRKNFFSSNLFSVGYATHGLYPYRGKFHPQMIKGIFNAIGLEKGETVLDPMCGSGTTLVEASILGIRSIGIDLNPFVCFMASAKLAGLTVGAEWFSEILGSSSQVFEFFGRAKRNGSNGKLEFATKAVRNKALRDELENDTGLRRLLGLAYLDAVGYAARRVNKTPRDLFDVVLARYLEAVRCFGESRCELGLRPAAGKVAQGDIRLTNVKPESVEAVVFSPPYSFALDYIENDRPQIEYLGYEVETLKDSTIGVRGGEGSNEAARIQARVERYFEDMDVVMRQSAAALKRGRCCVVVIGSNTSQTRGIRLEERIIASAARHGLTKFKHIVREIEGIHNTLKDEHLLFFVKE
ncbi:MAG: DNA methyltransferase, partial [bacterium]